MAVRHRRAGHRAVKHRAKRTGAHAKRGHPRKPTKHRRVAKKKL